MKRRAAVASFALLASACSARTPVPTSVGSGLGSPSPRTATHAPASPSSSFHAGRSRRATPTGNPGHTPSGEPGRQVYADDAGVGANSLMYLRSDPARKLIVEIDYVQGKKPASGALDHLREVLARETDKPDGVEVKLSDAMPPSGDTYTFAQLDQLEMRYRTFHSQGSVATLWIAFLNGQLVDGQGALGVSYRASTAALFADQIDDASSALVSPEAIQRSVFVHEAGHLLGLVGIGYESASDHEDPDHPHHSRYKQSVMYWAIEDITISTILRGGPPDDLDSYDKADLRMLRRG